MSATAELNIRVNGTVKSLQALIFSNGSTGQINTACRNGPNIPMITPALEECAGREAV